MSSLVIELQRDTLDPKIAASDLLRKALVVSRKLKVKEFQDWIELELNGYKSQPPDYRKIQGEIKVWNPYNEIWMPIVFSDPEEAEILSGSNLVQPVGELEALADNKLSSSFFHIPFSKDIESKFMKSNEYPSTPTRLVDYSRIHGILDQIRNTVLQWALKLEEDGIIGDGMSFSDKEKEKAAEIHYQIGNFISNISHSQIQQGAISSKQEVEITSENKEVLRELLKNYSEAKEKLELEPEKRNELEADMQSLSSQLDSPKPKFAVIQSCLKSVKSVLENAGGSVVGSLLLEQIKNVLL